MKENPISTVCDLVKETMQEMERRNFTHAQVTRFQKELDQQLIQNEQRFEDNKPFKVFRPDKQNGR